jgi:pyruvate kinase
MSAFSSKTFWQSFLVEDEPNAGFKLMQRLKQEGFFEEGEHQVVIVSGQQTGVSGGTDTIRVRTV